MGFCHYCACKSGDGCVHPISLVGPFMVGPWPALPCQSEPSASFHLPVDPTCCHTLKNRALLHDFMPFWKVHQLTTSSSTSLAPTAPAQSLTLNDTPHNASCPQKPPALAGASRQIPRCKYPHVADSSRLYPNHAPRHPKGAPVIRMSQSLSVPRQG